MKKTFIFILVISILLNLFLTMEVVDKSITVSYMSDEMKYKNRSFNILSEAFSILLMDKTKEEVVIMGERLSKQGAGVKWENDTYIIDKLHISFDKESDKVANLKLNF